MEVYTSNINDYDKVQEYNIINFTHKLDESKGGRWNNRWYKMHPHKLFPSADYWVYLDANVKLEVPVEEIVEKYGGEFISARRHPVRDCVYDEVAAVQSFGMEKYSRLLRVTKLLEESGLPKHWGLWEHNLLVMKNCPETIAFLEDWWEHYEEYTQRDQLLGSYLLFKKGKVFDDIPEEVISCHGHLKNRGEGE